MCAYIYQFLLYVQTSAEVGTNLLVHVFQQFLIGTKMFSPSDV